METSPANNGSIIVEVAPQAMSGLMMVVGTQHSLILGLERRVDAYCR
jgi:hypothetical protein